MAKIRAYTNARFSNLADQDSYILFETYALAGKVIYDYPATVAKTTGDFERSEEGEDEA